VILNQQDGWLTQIGIFADAVAGSGNTLVSVCKVVGGLPDLTQVIATVSVTPANLRPYRGETLIPVAPIFLQGGQSYAVVVQTPGAHSFASCYGNQVVNGGYFTYFNGAYQLVDANRSLMVNLYFAQFVYSYVQVPLASLSLSGGISAIDLLYDSVVPSSTQLKFEVQVGGVWYPLTSDTIASGVLNSAPNLVSIRAVFVGTSAVMPAFNIGTSQVKVTAPSSGFTHISLAQTVSSTNSITVIVDLEGWNGSDHAITCTLIVGGSPVSASTTTTHTTDTGIQNIYTFVVSSVTSFRVKLVGTTSVAGVLYHVADRTFIAF
jgi:hypothetical protein